MLVGRAGRIGLGVEVKVGTSKELVKGTVAPAFEPVRHAFEENFRKGLEDGAACAVYFRGEKVVDL